jgi:excisionase family DNA binding protein
MIPIPKTIKMATAIKRYGIDRSVITMAIKSGEIVAYKPGKHYLIVVDSADRWFFSKKCRPKGSPRKPR